MSDLIFKQNYFEIFSQAISTEIDVAAIKEKNHELQLQVHPDRFVNSSDIDKRLAMQKTSLINEAFEILTNPVSRLQYMLSLKGVDMNAETDTAMDGAFLMEQMELREDIAIVKVKANPLDELDNMSDCLKTQISALIKDFDHAYLGDELAISRGIVRKLHFLNKAQKEINEMIEQLEDELI